MNNEPEIDGLRLPRRSAGARLIRWAEATYPAVHDFLTNPAYGGAFVFGRTKVSRHLDETGRIVTRERELPLEDWEVTIPDHHLGYVSWQAYLANRERLRANARAPRGQGGGAVREGCAMLQGLVVCGKCGRRMLVSYSGPSGRVPRYVCAQGLRLYGSARSCQSMSGRRLDAAVVQEMFTVLQPAALAATVAALAEAEDQHARRVRAFELAVERARYEAERARRQFDAVEPENRLVARSLESDWEARLFTLRQPRPTSPRSGPGRRPCSPMKRWPGCPARALTCGRCSTPTHHDPGAQAAAAAADQRGRHHRRPRRRPGRRPDPVGRRRRYRHHRRVAAPRRR